MKIFEKINSESKIEDIETKKLIPVEKEIEIQENPILFEHEIRDKTAEEFFEEEKKEEEKKETGINIAELEELLRYILIVFHAWLFERKFKKKKPQGLEDTVLPLYLKILQKYNLMITEELALIGIYVFAIYTAEPISSEEEKKKEEKKEEKKENNLLKELEKLENE